MPVRLLKAATHRRMTWKNGGGETMEIAVHPEGAGLADFGWRVSMATVAADGPFSAFPGIDRTLAVLAGAGMHLDIAGQDTRFLDPTTPPLAFPADAATTARLAGGAITDLNVMTRRGAFTHRLTRGGDAPPAAWRLLIARAPITVLADGQTVALEKDDALLCDDANTALAPRGHDHYLVAIDPAQEATP